MRLFLHNGNILTMLEGSPPQESLLIEGDKIISVGAAGELASLIDRDTRSLDLGGRTVMPGFTDSHLHFVQVGLSESRLPLREARSISEVQDMVRTALDRTDSKPGERDRIIRGENWDESTWSGKRTLTRKDIDQVTAEVPVLLRRICGHMAVANRAGAMLVASRGGVIDSRSGIMLEETALNLDVLIPPLPAEEDEALVRAMARAASLGVTAVHDLSRASHVRAYERARRAGTLATRIVIHLWYPDRNPESPFPASIHEPDEMLWSGGVKVFLDGSLGARTAALMDPYLDDPGNRGMLLWDEPALTRLVDRAEREDRPLLLHAIGDRAVKVALSAIDTVCGNRADRLGHRLEHVELIDESDISKMARLGVVASVQPNFAGEWSALGGAYEKRLGRDRTIRANPFASLRRAGVPMAFGSDGMPFSPWVGITSALNHPHPRERFELGEALALYTRAGAELVEKKPRWGMIAAGSWADLVVLSGELMERERTLVTRPGGQTPQVELVLLGGEVIYSVRELSTSSMRTPSPSK